MAKGIPLCSNGKPGVKPLAAPEPCIRRKKIIASDDARVEKMDHGRAFSSLLKSHCPTFSRFLPPSG
jgi:hypothetical protein